MDEDTKEEAVTPDDLMDLPSLGEYPKWTVAAAVTHLVDRIHNPWDEGNRTDPLRLLNAEMSGRGNATEEDVLNRIVEGFELQRLTKVAGSDMSGGLGRLLFNDKPFALMRVPPQLSPSEWGREGGVHIAAESYQHLNAAIGSVISKLHSNIIPPLAPDLVTTARSLLGLKPGESYDKASQSIVENAVDDVLIVRYGLFDDDNTTSREYRFGKRRDDGVLCGKVGSYGKNRRNQPAFIYSDWQEFEAGPESVWRKVTEHFRGSHVGPVFTDPYLVVKDLPCVMMRPDGSGIAIWTDQDIEGQTLIHASQCRVNVLGMAPEDSNINENLGDRLGLEFPADPELPLKAMMEAIEMIAHDTLGGEVLPQYASEDSPQAALGEQKRAVGIDVGLNKAISVLGFSR